MLDTNKNAAKRLTAYCVAVTKEQEQKGREIKKSSIVKVKEEEGEAIVTAVCPSGVAYKLMLYKIHMERRQTVVQIKKCNH